MWVNSAPPVTPKVPLMLMIFPLFCASMCGITNLVHRATARAAELTSAELRTGGLALRDAVAEHRPAVVAVLGVTAYRDAFGVRDARVGRQDHDLEGAALWVVPNPSGLNAHETIESLAAAYAAPARAAGIELMPG